MLFFLSWCGYANPLSFMKLDESDLVYAENFVRQEILDRINEKCARLGKLIMEEEKELFFGMYADNIPGFQIMRGERTQLLGAASYLQKMFEQNGPEAFAKHFNVSKKIKIDKTSEINDFSMGKFYGKKISKCLLQKTCDSNEMVTQLFPKLKVFFESFELPPLQPIRKELVNIVDYGSGFRADVVCVFCESKNENESLNKKYAIQIDKNGCYNFSNLRKHVKRHISNVQKNIGLQAQNSLTELVKVEPATTDVSQPENKQLFDSILTEDNATGNNLDDIDIMSMPLVLVNDNNQSVSFDDNESKMALMYKQFSAQNLLLIKSTLDNSENKKYMALKIDDRLMNVNILTIQQDGNCMFSALVHQLQLVKIDSDQHKALTAKLRKDVVSYIELHYEEFQRTLKDRLNNATEDAGKEFVSIDLVKAGEWGGTETLMAVSRIYKVNILVFMEMKSFYFGCKFNEKYNRTIFLAYRPLKKKGNIKYDHYDSVCGINEDLLYKCAKVRAENLVEYIDLE